MRKAGRRRRNSLLVTRVQIWPQIVPSHLATSQPFQLQHMFRRRHPNRLLAISMRLGAPQPLRHSLLRHAQRRARSRLPANNVHRFFKRSRIHMELAYNPSGTTVNTSRSLNHYRGLTTVRLMRETLGTRLKKARTDAGLTQEQLAKASGVSQQAISKIERGAQAVSSAVVPLARACGVSPDWLSDGVEARLTHTVGAGPPVKAEPGSWLMQMIQIMIANGVSPEEAIRLSNEAAQAVKAPAQKKGSAKTG